jgi:hypothetical protein
MLNLQVQHYLNAQKIFMEMKVRFNLLIFWGQHEEVNYVRIQLWQRQRASIHTKASIFVHHIVFENFVH